MKEQVAKPTFDDYWELVLLRLAKVGRYRMHASCRDSYDSFYDNFFLERDRELYFKDTRYKVRRRTIYDYVKSDIPLGSRILDVGCGLGDVLTGMPEGYQLVGVDYSEVNVNYVKTRSLSKVEVLQGSMYDIPLANNSIDMCLCLEVLEHVADDRRAVIEISRVLCHNGILIVSVPHTYYWPEYERLMGHFQHYTRDSLVDLCVRNGYIVDRYLPNYPNWHHAYDRGYKLIRAWALFFCPLFRKHSVFDFRWPWAKQTCLARLAERLQPLFKKDERLPYPELQTSTFIVFRNSEQECC
jgi:SAM-dependent methyltransferase